ncbi:hypothetical protein LCGC14_0535210 [marine sediment metagenome]|uniref:Uncharacterized protein n=1 Tax=marine sediment metagenome TaxID=412755 RepID=A0A0F9V2M8_9ZZZZ
MMEETQQSERPQKQTGRPLFPFLRKKKQRKEPQAKMRSDKGTFSEGVIKVSDVH